MATLAAAGPALTAGVRHRAQGVADAAALAGAVAQGSGLDPCSAARGLVRAAGAGRGPAGPTLLSCVVEGGTTVDVEVALPWATGGATRLVGRPPPVVAHARASVAVVPPE